METQHTSPQLEEVLALTSSTMMAYERDVERIVGSYYAVPIRWIMNYGKVEMVLGAEGLPDTSKKLVKWGILRIEGEYLVAHPQIAERCKMFSEKFEKMLAKVKFLSENKSKMSEAEMAAAIQKFL